eukprot:6460445-Lingulodinium_polyedra.AAC.3
MQGARAECDLRGAWGMWGARGGAVPLKRVFLAVCWAWTSGVRGALGGARGVRGATWAGRVESGEHGAGRVHGVQEACAVSGCFEVYSCTLPPHTVVTKHAQRHCRVDTSPSSTDLPILMAPPRCRCGRRCTRYRGSGTLPSYVCSCAVCKYCGAFGIQL